MRTGDTIEHIPSGETWTVAFADRFQVICCGWPESIAKPSDCRLLKSCSDEEHWDLVAEIAEANAGLRSRRCFYLIDTKFEAECAAIMHL